jgi:dienelactone hydrolase
MSGTDVSRTGPGLVVVGLPAGAERDAAIARFSARGYVAAPFDIDPDGDVDGALAALKTAMDILRAAPATRGRIAVAGYGDAGALAFLAVTRLAADGALIVRGAGIGALLAESKFARVPMSMHFDDTDVHVPTAEVRKIKGALEGIGIIEIYRYERWDDAAEMKAEERAYEVLDAINAP